MILTTHETQTIYLVNDHEDNRTYQFDNAESALNWKKELIEEFDTDPENITVLERKFDEFGNWVSQKYI